MDPELLLDRKLAYLMLRFTVGLSTALIATRECNTYSLDLLIQR
jgi:hypothetical protein